MKNYAKVILYSFINLFFLILCLLISMQNYTPLLIIPISIYLIFICTIKEKDIIINEIIFLTLYGTIYTNLWILKPWNIPLELKYLVDVMNLILFFKIIIKIKTYKAILRDKIFVLSVIFIGISLVSFIFGSATLYDYLMSLRIYFRFSVIYIILSFNNTFTKKDLEIFILANLVTFLLEWIVNFGPDYRSGIFGTSNVQGLLLLMIILYGASVSLYLNKAISLKKYILITLCMLAISAISEIKFFLLLCPIITGVIFMFNLKKAAKIFKIIIPFIVLIIFGVSFLEKENPMFATFFDLDSLEDNVYNYTMKTNNAEYQLGRIENIVYTNDIVLPLADKKLMGLGVGYAMPDENWYSYTHNEQNSNRKISNIYSTIYYKQNGPYLGYHFSSINVLYMEMGLLGVLILFIALMIQFKRSKELLKKGNISDKCIGAGCISMITSLLFLLFYYPYLIDIDTMCLITIMMAITTNSYHKIKLRNKNIVTQ